MADTSFDDDLEAEAARVNREAKPRAKRSKFAGLADDDPRRLIMQALTEHVGCTTPTCFIRRADKAIVSKAAFDMEYNRIVNAIPKYLSEGPYRKKVLQYQDHAAQFAIASTGLQIVKGVCYAPGADDVTDGKFNMWQRPQIEPLVESPETFIAHMAYLIPDDVERKLVLDWLAWLVQRPTEKLGFALLIVGEGGTGKSWLGYLMEILIGESNATLLEKDTLIYGRFNSWCENKQLVFVHELAPTSKTDLMAAVAGVITEKTVQIERKGVDAIKLPNVTNLGCITNFPERIKMLRTNRRWAVVRATDDPVGVNARGEATEATDRYYSHLFECIGTPAAPGDEARRVLHYLASRDLSAFAGRGMAPQTGTKDDVAAGDSESIGAQVAQMHREHAGPFRYGLLTSAEAMAAIALPPVRTTEEHKALHVEAAAAMQAAGCRQVRIKEGGKVRTPQLRVIRGGPPVRLWAASAKLARRYEAMSAAELGAAYRAQREPDDPADDPLS